MLTEMKDDFGEPVVRGTPTMPSEDCVRFVPSDVVGIEGVTEVAIYADRLELLCGSQPWRFDFAQFARRQEPLVSTCIRRFLGLRAVLKCVGERQFCTDRRYVLFYSTPVVAIFTPPDFGLPHIQTFIFRIEQVLYRGGYQTFDLS